MSMRNIKLTVAYDGRNYHGFQRQSNALTVQQVLEERLSVIMGHAVTVIGAARTDAGVHAYGQVVNFTAHGRIPTAHIPRAVNSLLPDDIAVWQAAEVPASFHARYDARGKRYEYHIWQDRYKDPFRRALAWHMPAPLNVTAMAQALTALQGRHDFSAFRASGGAPVQPVRTIFQAVCQREGALLVFRFAGDGFLYHMVRNIVGTVVEIGQGRRPVTAIQQILAARDRNLAGPTAPAAGLFLREVWY